MTLTIIKYLNYSPYLDEKVSGGNNSVIIGNSFVGSGSILHDNVVIRGDGKKIHIGNNCIFKNRSTIHVAAKIQGTEIGSNSSIGEYSIIHACKLGNNTIIGKNAVIMDGSIVEKNSVIKDNSLVSPGKKFAPFSLIAGSPAKLIKKMNEKEYLYYKDLVSKNNPIPSENSFDYREYLKGKKISTEYNLKSYNKVFIAPDAEVFQSIKMEANSSIWFSVNIFSSKKNGKIILGEGSNIQDNSIINTLGEEIVIEKRVTIGHNVILLGSQNIKNDAVIGMGSILESNCIIGNNSFIGANSYVKSGTIVPDNTIFAGKPAKYFRKVNKNESLFFKQGQKIYENLTQEYNQLLPHNFC